MTYTTHGRICGLCSCVPKRSCFDKRSTNGKIRKRGSAQYIFFKASFEANMNDSGKHLFSLQHIVPAAVALCAIIIVGYWLEHHVTAIETWLAQMGHWAGAGFITLFIVLTPFFFSVDVLCVIAGALFGLTDAIAYVLIATMLAAAFIFYIGRYLARDRVQRFLEAQPKLMVFVSLIERDGFNIMFLLRLLPIPFALLSYVFSLSGTRFLPYWLATSGIFFYNSALVYFGYLAAHLSDRLGQGGNGEGTHDVLLFGGILLCALVMIVITKIAKTQIARLHPESDGLFEK